MFSAGMFASLADSIAALRRMFTFGSPPLNVVDYVCTFEEDTPLEAILEIRPDILVKGADWTDNIVGSKEVEGWGGKVVALPLVEGQSTTGIIERVLHRGSSV